MFADIPDIPKDAFDEMESRLKGVRHATPSEQVEEGAELADDSAKLESPQSRTDEDSTTETSSPSTPSEGEH